MAHPEATLCDDFEDASADGYAVGWTQPRGTHSLVRETDLVDDGVASAVATLTDAAVCTYHDLYDNLGRGGTHAKLSLRVRPSGTPAKTNDNGIITIAGRATPTSADFILILNQSASATQVEPQTQNQKVIGKTPRRRFQRSMDVRLFCTTGNAEIRCDDILFELE